MRVGDPICGDYGPRFVGHAEVEQTFFERWDRTIALALLIASLSFIVMRLTGKL